MSSSPGHKYALEVARHLGLDERGGALRVGLTHDDTTAEVDRALAALERLVAWSDSEALRTAA